MLQLMHADAVFRGASVRWSSWLEPDPQLVAKLDAAAEPMTWEQLEPAFSQ